MATRMQQRRGTAQQWTDENPTLAEGEIGFETDTYQFKIGDGVNIWVNLPYFETLNDIQTYVNNAVAGVIDAAPGTLDTLNELAAAINDDANFFNSITTAYQAYADQAEVDAKAYADTQDAAQTAAITAAYEAYVNSATTDSATTAYVDAGDAATEAAANTYADAGDATTLIAANAYTDAEITTLDGSLKTYADTAEADAVTTANAYTDGRETAITTAYQTYADQAEADAVTTANTYTDTAISNLVDGAPDALNTLDEIAAALNDDANLYTTLTNYVDTEIANAEPTFTNNFMLMGA